MLTIPSWQLAVVKIHEAEDRRRSEALHADTHLFLLSLPPGNVCVLQTHLAESPKH